MDGRTFRFIVGGFAAITSICGFFFEIVMGVDITWVIIAAHSVFLLMGLLLMDHKLGLEVLNKIARKVPGRRERGG